MNKGLWNANEISSVIIPGSQYRDKLTIQLHTGHSTTLSFDEATGYGEGIILMVAGDSVEVDGSLARGNVYGICVAGATSQGGWQAN